MSITAQHAGTADTAAAGTITPAPAEQPSFGAGPTTESEPFTPTAFVPAAAPSTPTASTPKRPSGVVRVLGLVTRGLTTLLLIIAAAAFLFLAVGPRFFGYQTSTMLTGSMSPLINPGDIVVTKRVPVTELKVGDIVTYSIPVDDHRIETHRVVEILSTSGSPSAIRTKGDANSGADPWTATLTEPAIDKEIFTVPYLGDAIRALRDPMVRTVLMYGAPGMLVVLLLGNIWKRPARPAIVS